MRELENECWKLIPNSKEYYISDMGRIRNKKGRILKSQFNPKTGFMQQLIYTIDGKPKLINIHRVVAELFLESPKDETLKLVTHISDDRTDNRVCNLQWSAKQKNINIEQGLTINGVCYKEKKKLYRYIIKQKLLNGFTIATFIDFDELENLGYKKQILLQVGRNAYYGGRNKYKGYLWEVEKQKLSKQK